MPIISTIEQIRAILPNVAAEVEYSDFKPHIEAAEDWIKNDILGANLYNMMLGTSYHDDRLDLLVHQCIVFKAYDIGIPYMDLIHTASGFGVVQDKNRAPASKQRVDRLISQNLQSLNQKLEYLIDHLEDTTMYHDYWKSSPAYSLISDSLIATAREFRRYVKFQGTRDDFLMLKPSLITLMVAKIEPQISKLYAQELLEKQNAGTLTIADKVVLPSLKQALANYIIEKDWLAKRLIEDVVTIMDANLDSYPTYRDSDEKALKDDPGHVNALEDPIFVFKGGM